MEHDKAILSHKIHLIERLFLKKPNTGLSVMRDTEYCLCSQEYYGPNNSVQMAKGRSWNLKSEYLGSGNSVYDSVSFE